MATECPVCRSVSMEVIDSRPSGVKNVLRRRRQCCRKCDYRCTTHEVIINDDTGHVSTHVNTAFMFKKEHDALLRKYFGAEYKASMMKEPKT